jgi:hypothetical protein
MQFSGFIVIILLFNLVVIYVDATLYDNYCCPGVKLQSLNTFKCHTTMPHCKLVAWRLGDSGMQSVTGGWSLSPQCLEGIVPFEVNVRRKKSLLKLSKKNFIDNFSCDLCWV